MGQVLRVCPPTARRGVQPECLAPVASGRPPVPLRDVVTVYPESRRPRRPVARFWSRDRRSARSAPAALRSSPTPFRSESLRVLRHDRPTSLSDSKWTTSAGCPGCTAPPRTRLLLPTRTTAESPAVASLYFANRSVKRFSVATWTRSAPQMMCGTPEIQTRHLVVADLEHRVQTEVRCGRECPWIGWPSTGPTSPAGSGMPSDSSTRLHIRRESVRRPPMKSPISW